jgi:hypothetical protein
LSRILGFLDKLNVEYLKSQIETGNAAHTKKALQEICKLYRDGFRIRPGQLIGVEQSIDLSTLKGRTRRFGAGL